MNVSAQSALAHQSAVFPRRRVGSASPARLVLSSAATPCHTPAGAVGNTPVLWIDEPFTVDGRGFWAKLEGHNPGGIKDRPALHMVECARSRGDLAAGAPIVESTSGPIKSRGRLRPSRSCTWRRRGGWVRSTRAGRQTPTLVAKALAAASWGGHRFRFATASASP